jgi:predicted dehydrogenase
VRKYSYQEYQFMTETIRVGIIGAGANTRSKHIPGLQAIEGVEIISVCNRSLESSQRVADEFGIPMVHENWWRLIDAGDINAVVIGTWPYMHERMTVRALAANKHVMCEARMARNLTEARAMLAASQAHLNLITQIVPSPMTLGVDKTIKRLLADGYLGIYWSSKFGQETALSTLMHRCTGARILIIAA